MRFASNIYIFRPLEGHLKGKPSSTSIFRASVVGLHWLLFPRIRGQFHVHNKHVCEYTAVVILGSVPLWMSNKKQILWSTFVWLADISCLVKNLQENVLTSKNTSTLEELCLFVWSEMMSPPAKRPKNHHGLRPPWQFSVLSGHTLHPSLSGCWAGWAQSWFVGRYFLRCVGPDRIVVQFHSGKCNSNSIQKLNLWSV